MRSRPATVVGYHGAELTISQLSVRTTLHIETLYRWKAQGNLNEAFIDNYLAGRAVVAKARAAGVDVRRAWRRQVELNWDPERAATAPVRKWTAMEASR